MNIVIEQRPDVAIPNGGVTHVAFQLEADLKVSAEQAQDFVRRLVAKIGPCVRAESPELVIGERICWRVPVVLSLPGCGDIGVVDWVQLDAQNLTRDLRARLVDRLAWRAQALANSAPPALVPPEFKVRVPAVVAKRAVTSWLIVNAGNLLGGGQPRLAEGDPRTWQVPVMMKWRGQWFELAVVEVDAESGNMTAGQDLVEYIWEKSRAITGSSSPTGE